MKTLVCMLVIMSTLLGCYSNLQGDYYSREDARAVQRVQYGVVEDVRMVVIEGTKSGLGAIAAGAVGGIAGSTVGGGKGKDIATIVGAVAGGVLGSKAEEAATRTQGVEVVVRLEGSGKLIAIVQAFSANDNFSSGDRVRVMTINGNTRVAQ